MKKYYFLSVLLILLNLGAHAQRSNESFIETLKETQISLNTKQRQKVSNIQRNNMYKKVSFVRVGNLSTIQQRGALPIEIPGRPGRLVARVTSVEAISDTEYTWIGEFVKEEGTVMIMASEGRVFGHITVGNAAYEIHDLGNEINLLLQINDEMYTGEECATQGRGSETKHQNGNRSLLNHQSSVRILVLYTQNAENSVANINDVARLSVQQMNSALVNSNVNNLRISLAGIQELNFIEHPDGDIFDDIDRLSFSVNAQMFRDTFEADLVLLLTNGNYGTVMGIVAEIGPINNLAYGIVEADAASGRYTFAHEAAHLFGARHETDPDPTFAHGHNFKTGIWPFRTERRTILNTLPSGESRILHFSNPDVEYNNKETGTSSRDNARQLEEQAAVVEGFRDFTPPLSVSILGPSFGSNSGTYSWTSTVTNGVAPYTYRWDYSTDGFSYSLFRTTANISASLPYDENLYLRLTVTDSNGGQAMAFHFTSNGDAEDCIKCVNDEELVAVDSTSVTNTIMYPNPTEDEVNISYETTEANTEGSIMIYDFLGNVVSAKRITEPEIGKKTVQLHLSGLKNGQYYLKLQTGANSETKRLIISR